MSPYDRAHVGSIIGGEGSWFTARLLRALDALLPYADSANQARLENAYPEEVAAYEAWYRGEVVPLITGDPVDAVLLAMARPRP